jgi:hypothetical protein
MATKGDSVGASQRFEGYILSHLEAACGLKISVSQIAIHTV